MMLCIREQEKVIALSLSSVKNEQNTVSHSSSLVFILFYYCMSINFISEPEVSMNGTNLPGSPAVQEEETNGKTQPSPSSGIGLMLEIKS